MTNRVALGIGAMVLLAAALNFALGLEIHIELGRQFLRLIDWLAFWR